jgi:hypothetical protein
MDNKQLKDFIWNAVSKMEAPAGKDPSPATAYSAHFGGGALSFGYMQNDVGPVAMNTDARDTFEKVMDKYYGVTPKTRDDVETQIIRKAEAGQRLYGNDLKIVNLALAADQTDVNALDARQLEKVTGRVKEAFAAAAGLDKQSKQTKDPGELNSIAPDPELLAEVAEWANMTSPDTWTKTIQYLKQESKISQTNFEKKLYTFSYFVKHPDFITDWPGRVRKAATYSEGKVGATVIPLDSDTINSNNVSSTGSNYLALYNNAVIGAVGILWEFNNSGTAGNIGVSMSGVNLGTFSNGDWTKISVSGNELKLSNEMEIPDWGHAESEKVFSINTSNMTFGEKSTSDKKTKTDPSSWDQTVDMSGTNTDGSSKNIASVDTKYSSTDDAGNPLSKTEDKIDASGNITSTDTTYDSNGKPTTSVIKIDAKVYFQLLSCFFLIALQIIVSFH